MALVTVAGSFVTSKNMIYSNTVPIFTFERAVGNGECSGVGNVKERINGKIITNITPKTFSKT